MHKFKISPSEAIAQIREARPIAEPNDGFMQQLELYHRMQMTDRVEESPVYQRWLYQREVQLSSDCGKPPDADKIRFEDEHVDENADTSNAEKELRCKKCRYVSANFPYEGSVETLVVSAKPVPYFSRTADLVFLLRLVI